MEQEKKSQVKQKLLFLILKAGAFAIFIAITFFLYLEYVDAGII